MAKSDNLRKAKENKNDEFYTLLTDIENELKNYKEYFKNKVVLCNCDDPYESNFFKYFAMNFNYLGLKKLIATCHKESFIAGTQLSLFDFDNVGDNIVKDNRKAYIIEINEMYDANKDGAIDLVDVKNILQSSKNRMKILKGDGDFRSDECIEFLKKADIIVTNPPFSLFREYVSQLIQYKKQFLIIGNINAISYKEIFPLIKNNEIWLGYKNGSQEFLVPKTYSGNNTYIGEDGNRYAKFGNICWFTNLDTTKRHEMMILYKSIKDNKYIKYDNFDGININKLEDIPVDYFGYMGVPVTFLDKHNPKQFKIIGMGTGDNAKKIGIEKNYRGRTDLAITENGVSKCPYNRIIIQKNDLEELKNVD